MPEASDQEVKRLRIRKYPNRRYYDTTRSRHVTLDEIYSLIREGHEVEVIDSKSGVDITAKILAQIIIELDPPKLGVFPVPLLHRLLRSNERMMGDFVHKYFNQPLTAFLDQQRNMEQYFRQAIGLRTPAPTVADLAKMMWSGLNPGLWPGGQPAASPETAANEASTADLRAIIADLRRELTELRAHRGRTTRKRSKKRSK